MMKPIQSHSDGYIALITVLVVTAVCSAIATSLLLFGTAWLQTSQASENAQRARQAADSCTEAALAQIAASGAFTGSNAITLSVTPAISCSYTVSGAAPTKTITTSGVAGNATKKLTTTTSQVSPTIIISGSQIVP